MPCHATLENPVKLLGVHVERGLLNCARDKFGGLRMLLIRRHGRYSRSGSAVVHGRLRVLNRGAPANVLAHPSNLLILGQLIAHLLLRRPGIPLFLHRQSTLHPRRGLREAGICDGICVSSLTRRSSCSGSRHGCCLRCDSRHTIVHARLWYAICWLIVHMLRYPMPLILPRLLRL